MVARLFLRLQQKAFKENKEKLVNLKKKVNYLIIKNNSNYIFQKKMKNSIHAYQILWDKHLDKYN